MNTLFRRPGLLLFLLLTSCTPIVTVTTFPTTSPTSSPTFVPAVLPTILPTISPTVSPTVPATPAFHTSLDAFRINDQCPHICWLGINPGVTTVEEARTLLRASDQIDQKNFYEINNYIQINWFFEGKTWHCQVTVSFSQGRVKKVDLCTTLTVAEAIHLLGEPDEIKIGIYSSPHEALVAYALYYSVRKTLLWIVSYGWDGPNPYDNVQSIVLNTDGTNEFGYESDVVQPWLGYGRLKDYLPEAKLPKTNP